MWWQGTQRTGRQRQAQRSPVREGLVKGQCKHFRDHAHAHAQTRRDETRREPARGKGRDTEIGCSIAQWPIAAGDSIDPRSRRCDNMRAIAIAFAATRVEMTEMDAIRTFARARLLGRPVAALAVVMGNWETSMLADCLFALRLRSSYSSSSAFGPRLDLCARLGTVAGTKQTCPQPNCAAVTLSIHACVEISPWHTTGRGLDADGTVEDVGKMKMKKGAQHARSRPQRRSAPPSTGFCSDDLITPGFQGSRSRQKSARALAAMTRGALWAGCSSHRGAPQPPLNVFPLVTRQQSPRHRMFEELVSSFPRADAAHRPVLITSLHLNPPLKCKVERPSQPCVIGRGWLGQGQDGLQGEPSLLTALELVVNSSPPPYLPGPGSDPNPGYRPAPLARSPFFPPSKEEKPSVLHSTEQLVDLGELGTGMGPSTTLCRGFDERREAVIAAGCLTVSSTVQTGEL
ncbi:hypothetical protein FALBO_16296 [Fusarium albosuccineum]|uniref:Uncharacterized protein n=1 Tax=Fusarium albosuccineum TaxID=1237068 RepID=A0A8H4NXQ4_9HYPO|nr:hypothetical protein FALBO_16296 [Fusarium albosuccineum]